MILSVSIEHYIVHYKQLNPTQRRSRTMRDWSWVTEYREPIHQRGERERGESRCWPGGPVFYGSLGERGTSIKQPFFFWFESYKFLSGYVTTLLGLDPILGWLHQFTVIRNPCKINWKARNLRKLYFCYHFLPRTFTLLLAAWQRLYIVFLYIAILPLNSTILVNCGKLFMQKDFVGSLFQSLS